MTERKPYTMPKLEPVDLNDPRMAKACSELLGQAVGTVMGLPLGEATTNVQSIACNGCMVLEDYEGALTVAALSSFAALHLSHGKGLRLVVRDEAGGQGAPISIDADTLSRVGPATRGFLEGMGIRRGLDVLRALTARTPVLPSHCEGDGCRWMEGDVDSEEGGWQCTCACAACVSERQLHGVLLDEPPLSFAGVVELQPGTPLSYGEGRQGACQYRMLSGGGAWDCSCPCATCVAERALDPHDLGPAAELLLSHPPQRPKP